MGDTGIQLWRFCCVTIICNFVCIKQQNRLSLILAQRMSKYQKIIDNREPRTIFKAPPIWDCRIELLQRSVARLRPLSLGQNAQWLGYDRYLWNKMHTHSKVQNVMWSSILYKIYFYFTSMISTDNKLYFSILYNKMFCHH